ncbi:transcriptional regulator with XRE-family HTH domain [Arthrobacter sp. CAN_A2]|uniref:helix-turn-helix domain-containing protein n=1 Tax=Arthrobacter sp. CAN_A2 TaxID=2787718 RepID=UPI0018EFC143
MDQQDWRPGGEYGYEFVRTLDENFGQNARIRREFLDYPQNTVARLMTAMYGFKWHQTVVAKVESGQRMIKLSEAYALADLYGVPLENLAHGTDLQHVEQRPKNAMSIPEGLKWLGWMEGKDGEHPEEA